MRCFFFFLVSFFCVAEALPNWQRSVTNYSRQTYKAANQNWMVAQHENGWMYFANNKGLLEFDGTTWNTYSIHNAKTRTVKCGDNGKVYVGGLGQFGYFTPNKLGGLDYVCLSDSIQQGAAGNIWNIHLTDNCVYFQSDRSIFCLEDGKLTQIGYTHEIMHSAIIHNKLYCVSEEGLLVLNEKKLSPLPETGHIAQSKVIALLPYNDELFIVSSRNGIYTYNGKEALPYHSTADSFLHSNQLFCAAMKDSLLALGSVQDGVLLLNLHSNEVEKISTTNGLQNKTVLSLLFDRESNLWLGLDNGIDCINLGSPMFFLYSNKTAIGSGYASYQYKDKLYLGTNQGVYVVDFQISPNKEVNLDFIPGTEGQIWSITEYDNKLFCCGGNALTIIDDSRISQLKGIRGVWSVAPLNNHPDCLLAGTYNGLYLLIKNNGEWEVANKIEGAIYSAKTMFVEGASDIVWVANKEKGLFRVHLSSDLKTAEVKSYNDTQLPAGNNVYLAQINDEVVVASRQGLFRYNSAMDCLEKHTTLEVLLDGEAAYTHISQDESGDIWYVTDGHLKLARYNPKTRSYYKDETESYLKGFLIEDFEHIYTHDRNQAIIGTEEGFSLLLFNKTSAKKFPLNLQIRKVYLTMGKDSLIYGRSFNYDNSTLVIPYKYNSIRVEYSVDNYNKSLTTLYAHQLIGDRNEEWSEYSGNSTKEYTNLKEGKYTFNVKIIANKDKEPVSASFSFEILPPWYRTWWAYTIYVLSIIYLLVYWSRQISKRQKRTIRQQGREIDKQKEENELKEQKIISLTKEKLQADLNHRSNELMYTTLNIVRKNEILQEIKKEAVAISHSVNEENLPNIRRKMLRLISNIDTNIEHDDDLRTFETAFDSLHHNFFEKLDTRFPELNKKEKLMCAYIRMDLLSKEIAPLMNISVRGVEISRYRLRKKLHLSQEDNLALFLQKI